ncbi:MAG TPA: hypothetical protein VGP78_11445 [Solirubrobacteraceae bacterium]|nr:hypothetical protein [Solirubrobacteraceae bacterium]
MAQPCVTFADLHDTMRAAGVEVRVAREDEEAFALSLVDFARCRSVAVPVPRRGFDAAATTLCCSLALAAIVPGFGGAAAAAAREWPELAQLALAAA